MLTISGLQPLLTGLNNTTQKSAKIINGRVNRITVLCNDFSTSQRRVFVTCLYSPEADCSED